MCSYDKPLSAAQTSVDPVLVQQRQSPTEVTVNLTLSRTESDLATHEKVSECQNECKYVDIDDTHRKSRSAYEEFLDVQERTRNNSMPSDHPEKGTSGLSVNPASCIEIEDYTKAAVNETLQAGKNAEHLYEVLDNTNKKDHDYAVVHKQRNGRVCSETCALKESPGRPQKGTSGLPVNRASCVGIEETPQASEKAEYLYAVVDKRNKKKKAPQVPTPYRGLVYPVLVHSRGNSA
ncbi:hypothetical protein AWC38_SpisGene6915 [Stylophora pistillata]|uniref:Uncharacterized protein n=1 Tax=Stylophora pistillata TaxID=50429 RepID=A0A2B4SG32_STYPI|nr:hypothetical protein AWC38_SpisGene6915 [Stylophora pistillata]